MVKMSNNHGGIRPGAGRKSLFNEPTKVIRVPESTIVHIQDFLKQRLKRVNEVESIHQIVAKKNSSIPLALEKISAGPPSNTEGYIEKPLDLNTHLIKNELATFAVKVASLSMLNAGININDILIVDRSLTAKSEDIVVALVDNEFTVKRLMIEGDYHWLKAENPDFSDIHLKDNQELIIWGVVTYSIKSLR